MIALKDTAPVTAQQFQHYLQDILTPEQQHQFAQNKELDTAVYYEGFARCRVNCFESLS